MKVGSILLGLFLVFCMNINITLAQEAQVKDLYIELILDAFNSMNEPLGGTKKIDIAKQVLNGVLNDLSPDTYLALRVYGSDITKLSVKYTYPLETNFDEIQKLCLDGYPRKLAKDLNCPLGDKITVLLRRRSEYRYNSALDAWNDFRTLLKNKYFD